MRIQRNIGCTLTHLGAYAEAITAFEAVMETAPDVQAGFNLVVCYYALGNPELMRKCVRAAAVVVVGGWWL